MLKRRRLKGGEGGGLCGSTVHPARSGHTGRRKGLGRQGNPKQPTRQVDRGSMRTPQGQGRAGMAIKSIQHHL